MNPRQAVNIFFAINGLMLATLASRFVQIKSMYGLDNKSLGILLLVMSVGALLGMPVTGWLIHKYGSKKIMTVSGLCLSLVMTMLLLMPSWILLFLPFIILGASNGIMDVSMNAHAVEVEKIWKRSIMTFFHAVFSVGMMVGALIGSLCIRADISPGIHYLCIGIIAFFILIFTQRYLLKDAEEAHEEEMMFAIPKGALIGLGVIAFCCMMGEGAMTDWSAIYMERIVESTEDLQVAGLFTFAGFMALGRFVGDSGRDKYGDKVMMVSGAIISLVGMVLVLSLMHPYLVIFGFGLVGLGLSNIVPIVFSLAGNYPGIQPGVGIAAATTIGYSGFVFGPPLIGFIADAYDMRIALGLLGVLFLIMAALVLMYKTEKKA